jgi:hypothetical protein
VFHPDSDTTIAMTLRQTILVGTLAIVAATGSYATLRASRLRVQLQSVSDEQAPLNTRLAQLQAERKKALTELAAAHADLALERSNSAEILRLRAKLEPLQAAWDELSRIQAARTNEPTESTVTVWIVNVLKFQRRIADLPGPRIPEFKYLTTMDWLDKAKETDASENDDQFKATLRSLDSTAREHFGVYLRDALNQYVDAHNGLLPNYVADLKPYFSVPVDDDIFQYYEMLHTGNVADVTRGERDTRLIAEKPSGAPDLKENLIQVSLIGIHQVGQNRPPE